MGRVFYSDYPDGEIIMDNNKYKSGFMGKAYSAVWTRAATTTDFTQFARAVDGEGIANSIELVVVYNYLVAGLVYLLLLFAFLLLFGWLAGLSTYSSRGR